MKIFDKKKQELISKRINYNDDDWVKKFVEYFLKLEIKKFTKIILLVISDKKREDKLFYNLKNNDEYEIWITEDFFEMFICYHFFPFPKKPDLIVLEDFEIQMSELEIEIWKINLKRSFDYLISLKGMYFANNILNNSDIPNIPIILLLSNIDLKFMDQDILKKYKINHIDLPLNIDNLDLKIKETILENTKNQRDMWFPPALEE